MPYISELSSNVQNLVMLNFEFFSKKLLLGLALIFSISYLFYFREHQEETPYLLVGIWRLILVYLSRIYLTSFPLFVFFLYPQVRLDIVLNFMIAFYSVLIFVVGAFILLNIMYFGYMILVKIAGYNPDKRTDKVVDGTFGVILKSMGFNKWKLPNFYDRFHKRK